MSFWVGLVLGSAAGIALTIILTSRTESGEAQKWPSPRPS
jgi:hypothetical protein